MYCKILLSVSLIIGIAIGEEEKGEDIVKSFSYTFHRHLRVPPPPNEEIPDAVTGNWFLQTVDHFDSSNTANWYQQYFVNNQYWTNSSGPVFLLMSGENPVMPGYLSWGDMENIAQANNALMFTLEHRFYGQSQPTSDWSTTNLKFLTSEQALADDAAFIQAQITAYSMSGNQWITFGGSYSGSLSAWMRLKYPNLITGSVASSAPVQAEYDFYQYYEVITQSLDYYEPGCSSQVQQAFQTLQGWVQSGDSADIAALFPTCPALDTTNSQDVSMLFDTIAGTFAGVVQYNNQDPSKPNINSLCDIMLNSTIANPVNSLYAVYTLVNGNTCYDMRYSSYVSGMQNTQISYTSTDRQWTFQTCNEFGYSQSSDASDQVFGSNFPASYWAQMCTDIYGSNFNSASIQQSVDNTNNNYGGTGIDSAIGNIIFVNGGIDPWHALGVTSPASGSSNTVIFMPVVTSVSIVTVAKDLKYHQCTSYCQDCLAVVYYDHQCHSTAH